MTISYVALATAHLHVRDDPAVVGHVKVRSNSSNSTLPAIFTAKHSAINAALNANTKVNTAKISKTFASLAAFMQLLYITYSLKQTYTGTY